MQVVRIFTDMSISPSLSPRQRPDRYTFRAGRNLPDKEFRYLRTVIVTAAVHRGFNSGLAPLLLTFRHRAGVTPYTSSCEFAECYVFAKQSARPGHCDPAKLRGQAPSLCGHSFFQRYGVNLQSSLTWFLSSALVFSTCPPVSVWGTVCRDYA